MSQPYDFVALGDITTDEFIQLKEDKAVVNTDLSGRQVLSMYFGDKLEFEGAVNVPAVGNSPNAAVSAHRLGLNSTIYTNVGDDEGGKEILATLRDKEKMDTALVFTHSGKTTNHHYVLRYGAERTILVKHERFEYKLPDVAGSKWLYFSSVGEHSIPFHHEVAAWLKEHPDSKLAFQPGSFQIQLGYEALKDIYAVTELFFCNKEEARTITGADTSEINELLTKLHALGPKIAIITDGPKGAYTFDGSEMWHMPMYPDPGPPVDRTGAGDAFASTFTAALALGKPIPEALSWGPINSMNVVQYIGAQEGLLTREKIEAFLASAPADYKASKI